MVITVCSKPEVQWVAPPAGRRYDLKLWVGHSHEGAAYLPR